MKKTNKRKTHTNKFITRIATASLVCMCSITLFACNKTTSNTDQTADTNQVSSTDASNEHDIKIDADSQLIYTVDNDHIIIMGINNDDSGQNLIIPETIDGLPVTHIGANAFQANLSIEKVSLPNSVTTIMKHAFDDCSNLKEITLSENLKTIEEGAFFCCADMANIDFPDGLTYIGKGAFYSCTALKTIIIPDSVTTVDDYAFCQCENITNFTLGSGLSVINARVFKNCQSLTDISIPDTIKSIKDEAFFNCLALEKLTLPKELDEIGNEAFNCCSSLDGITVNARSIGDEAFVSCSMLSNIELSDKIEHIGNFCFRGTAIETINIPANLPEEDVGAFKSMFFLLSFNADANPHFTVYDDVLYNADMTTLYCFPAGKSVDVFEPVASTATIEPYAFMSCKLEKFVANEGLEVIKEGAFFGCDSLTEIKLSNSVNTIEAECFDGTLLSALTLSESIANIDSQIDAHSYIENIYVDDNNKNFTSIDGVVFTKDKKSLVLCPVGKGNESYSIPDGTETICKNAFRGCYSIDSVTVPASVTKIEELGLADVRTITFEGTINELEEYAIGYKTENTIECINSFLIIGKFGTALEQYAMDNNLGFASATPTLNEENVSLKQGETFKLSLSNTNPDYISFYSSDESIATVDADGTITGIAKGQTSIIAVNGQYYSICNVDVTSGDEPVVSANDYFSATVNNYSEWENKYYNSNSNIFDDEKYNNNIHVYTGNEYIPIVAAQEGEIYPLYEHAISNYDLSLYKMIGDGLNIELSRGNIPLNTILYSGTDATEISRYTKSGSSIEDMINSIGTVTTHDEVISTSLSQCVAESFGEYVLEIYAPANITKGAYLKKFSRFPYEYELLLASGQKFKVIGAGIRVVNPEPFDEFMTRQTRVEKYLQLQIVE